MSEPFILNTALKALMHYSKIFKVLCFIFVFKTHAIVVVPVRRFIAIGALKIS